CARVPHRRSGRRDSRRAPRGSRRSQRRPEHRHLRAPADPHGDERRQGGSRMSVPTGYDLPSPHGIDLTVDAPDIDAYDHVNNAVYVTWCDRSAWEHSAALGLPIERCLELDRGMAVVRTVLQYLRP